MTTKINANVGTITPSTHNIPLGDDISITLEGKLPLNLDGLKLTVPINYTRDISADMLETLLIDNGPYDVALGIISKRLKIISQPISSAPKDCIDLCLRQGSIQNRVGSYKKYVDVCIKAYIDTKDENYATLAKTKYTEGKNSKGVDYYWKETFDPKYIRFSII